MGKIMRYTLGKQCVYLYSLSNAVEMIFKIEMNFFFFSRRIETNASGNALNFLIMSAKEEVTCVSQ